MVYGSNAQDYKNIGVVPLFYRRTANFGLQARLLTHEWTGAVGLNGKEDLPLAVKFPVQISHLPPTSLYFWISFLYAQYSVKENQISQIDKAISIGYTHYMRAAYIPNMQH